MNWVITSDAGRASLSQDMGFVTPFDTFTDEYQAQNPLVAAANEYIEAGKESVAWCFTTMPSENWKNGLGSALLEYAQGNVTKEKLDALDIEQARELLMTIKGVGEKVANCVLLFGLGRREAFPVDVWMKRIMESMYFDGKDTKKLEIEAFAVKKFGNLGGYAQQYLFDYARTTLFK